MLRLITLLVAVGMTALQTAAQTPYKEFKRTVSLDQFFTLTGDKTGLLTINSPRLSAPVQTHVPVVDSVTKDTVLNLPNGVAFHADRMTAGNMDFLYSEIVDIRIESRHDTSVVVLFTSPDTARSISRMRMGNIISAFSPVRIDSLQFVRGSVFTVTGDIAIAGEVNRDVVTLFGKVTTTAGGVVRGGTVTLFGRLEISKGSTVYGSILSPRRKLTRKFQILSRDRELNIDPNIWRNRVDGLGLSLGLEFHDDDSLLPSVWASGGYAFASERGRYKFGIEQTISKSRTLVAGAEAYRKLSSDDDRILGDDENLAYVVFAREDFKDYYEAEGGRAYAHISPFSHATLGVEYRNEATHWLDAHPRLWAIFGGHKRFGDNFSTVDPVSRSVGIAEIESTTVAGVNFSADFDSRSKTGVYKQSAWHFEGNLEWSQPGFGSDFDYRRYTLSATRYQTIHKESMLLFKGTFGGSSGYLPMHRKFYLGGIGGWQGYGQKEYYGNSFWMTTLEYRLTIPGSEFALSTFWDCGQYAPDGTLTQSSDAKNSIGMALYLGASFRVSVAKRLDRSDNDSPKIYLRLAHHF